MRSTGQRFFKKEGKAFSIEATLTSSELAFTSHIEGQKKADTLSGFVKADIRSREALLPFYVFPVDLSFIIETSFEGSWKSFSSLLSKEPLDTDRPIKGFMTSHLRSFKERDMPGTCEASFSFFPTRALDIHHLSLKSDLVCFKGEGRFDGHFFPKNISGSFLFPTFLISLP
ncbi:MAG: hypothetical protein LVR00_01210 [Rhabdochlamydiaceae bacterium]|jgi:hypothetical protein